MELTKEILSKIIDKFAADDKVFSNEAQFQYALALALKEHFGKDKVEIFLEVLSSTKTLEELNKLTKAELDQMNKKQKSDLKMYTDIVVKIGEKYYAIELKYKTAAPSSGRCIIYEKDNKQQCTFSQGAYDEGSYDFIKDVERLERLVLDRKDKIVFNFDEKKTIENGFAIILTNEMMYWSKNDAYGHERNLNDSPYKYYYSFDRSSKDEPFETIGDGILGGENKKRSAERESSIKLNKLYLVQWIDYKLNENFKIITPNSTSKKKYNFKYLIFDVKYPQKILMEKE